jgi:beta-glucosidase
MNVPLLRLAALGICVSAGWSLPEGAQTKAAQVTSALSEDVVRSRADALIAQMSPEEKAGQLSQYFYLPQFTSIIQEAPAAIAAGQIGSLLMVSDPRQTNRLQRIAVEQSRLKIPLLFGFDVIHGLHTIFPVPLALAATWDTELVEQTQSAAAAEARAMGIHWAFAPMLDVSRDPRWGRMVESPGEDPYLGAAMAVAQVRGFQGPYIGSPGHLIAGPKHFAGYGAALGGRDYDEVDLSESQLWNVYLVPFKAAIDAGAGNIMCAYMSLNGVPACGNRWLLTHVLRETWGFKGFTVSDSGAVRGLVTHGAAADEPAAAARALDAGIDMEMAPPKIGRGAYHNLPGLLRDGRVTNTDLDHAVRDVLAAKIRMGLFETPYVDESEARASLSNPNSVRLARLAAERSAVLLRNENALLPLNRRSLKSLAVIGPLADSARDLLGPWVFPQNEPASVSILSALRARLAGSVRVDYSEGVRIPPRIVPSPFAMLEHPPARPPLDESSEIQRAVDLAQKADAAILVLGETWDMAGETASRSSLDLPGRQQELLDRVLATAKPVVVLLISGRPLDLKQSKVAALMQIWYPGSEGAAAVANLLFGDAAPAGRLPVTWVDTAGQAPLIYAHLTSHDPRNAEHRYFDAPSNAPRYPFGYGLSYTTFAYSNLSVERPTYAPGEPVAVQVEVKNTGTRAGDEVAQLYIHQRFGSAARPVRELKGFQRISLRAGESRALRFQLRAQDLSYWSSASGGWTEDETTFDVWVGGSSTADLATQFDVRQP